MTETRHSASVVSETQLEVRSGWCAALPNLCARQSRDGGSELGSTDASTTDCAARTAGASPSSQCGITEPGTACLTCTGRSPTTTTGHHVLAPAGLRQNLAHRLTGDHEPLPHPLRLPQLGLESLHPLPSGALTLRQQPHHRRHPGTSTEETTPRPLPPKHHPYT
ncbi:hypothetical protein AB5J56_44630 [Streptomyces sp. R21]|uniref:Uncharacterized protein n=1 Tax=Streptomyces sp. R21 TaxID=3238627 RepID=A0AB39PN81_9ACTN